MTSKYYVYATPIPRSKYFRNYFEQESIPIIHKNLRIRCFPSAPNPNRHLELSKRFQTLFRVIIQTF